MKATSLTMFSIVLVFAGLIGVPNSRLRSQENRGSIKTLRQTNEVITLAFVGENHVALITRDHEFQYLSLKTGKKVYTYDTGGAHTFGIAKNKQSFYIPVSSKIMELKNGREVRIMGRKLPYFPSVMALSPSKALAAIGYLNVETLKRHVAVVTLDDKLTEICELNGHKTVITSIAFSPDGKKLLSGAHDGAILWDLEKKAIVKKIMAKRAINEVVSVGYSENGQLLACSFADKVILLTAANFKPIRHWDAPGGSQIAFSPDGRYLVIGGYPKNKYVITMWRIDEPKAIRQIVSFAGHTAMVRSLSFSSKGRRLASGGDDKTIKIWELPKVVENRQNK